VHYLEIVNSFWKEMSDVVLLRFQLETCFYNIIMLNPLKMFKHPITRSLQCCILEKMPVATYAR